MLKRWCILLEKPRRVTQSCLAHLPPEMYTTTQKKPGSNNQHEDTYVDSQTRDLYVHDWNHLKVCAIKYVSSREVR